MLHATTKPKLDVQISEEDFIVIQVAGKGIDATTAGQRVLELTSPLAMAGMYVLQLSFNKSCSQSHRSIFFITTYQSDYILVPFRSRRTVVTALQQRGFVFSKDIEAFVSQLSPSSPTTFQPSSRPTSSDQPVPSTPPAKDIPELQLRTFTKLRKNNITPSVDPSIRLASCGGNPEYSRADEEKLRNDLLQVLLATASFPSTTTVPDDLDFGAKFLSLTITTSDPISILLEHRLLPRLGSTLLGAKRDSDTLIPITLDLRDLPLDATGIVCGVAGRLAQGELDEQKRLDDGGLREGGDENFDISFLSTARAGTVVVREGQLRRAVEALEVGMRRVAEKD
jgi:hypothetical protein